MNAKKIISSDYRHTKNNHLLNQTATLNSTLTETHKSSTEEWISPRDMIHVKRAAQENNVRKIMGQNFIGVLEWEALFGRGALDGENIPDLPKNIMDVIRSKSKLMCGRKAGAMRGKSIHETHKLFLMPSKLNGRVLNMLEWDHIMKENGFNAEKPEWKSQPFAKKRLSTAKWILMPKRHMPRSIQHIWGEQKTVLERNYKEHAPIEVNEFVTGIFLHYLQTGERLVTNALMRTRTWWDGYNVIAGIFTASGLYILPRQVDSNIYCGYPIGLWVVPKKPW